MADAFDPGRANGRWKLRLTNDVSLADVITIGVVLVTLIGGYFRLEARMAAQETAAARQEREFEILRGRVEQQRDAGTVVLQRLATIEANQNALAGKLAEQTELLKELRSDLKNGNGRK